jgi:hypothetical protein
VKTVRGSQETPTQKNSTHGKSPSLSSYLKWTSAACRRSFGTRHALLRNDMFEWYVFTVNKIDRVYDENHAFHLASPMPTRTFALLYSNPFLCRYLRSVSDGTLKQERSLAYFYLHLFQPPQRFFDNCRSFETNTKVCSRFRPTIRSLVNPLGIWPYSRSLD